MNWNILKTIGTIDSLDIKALDSLNIGIEIQILLNLIYQQKYR